MIFNNKATLSLVFLFGITVQHAWCMENDNDGYFADDAVASVIGYAPPLDPNIVDIACADVPLDVQDLIDQLHEYPTLPLLTKLYLFVGEPGAGKTTLARAVAQKGNWPCVMVPVTELPNEYQDSAAAGLIRYFNPILEDDNKCVIVLDEITHLTDNFKKGHNNHDRTATTLWRIFDKCIERKNILVIGTANDIDTFPAPLKDRFDEGIITIPMPSLKTRTLFMKNLFENSLTSQSITDAYLKNIAHRANNKSFREMIKVFNKASRIARRQKREITEEDINEAINLWRSWYHPVELCTSLQKKGESALSFCAPAFPYIRSAAQVGLAITPIVLQILSMRTNNQQIDYQKGITSQQLEMQHEGLDLQRSSHELQVDGAALQRKSQALQELAYHVQRLSVKDLYDDRKEFIFNKDNEYNFHAGYYRGTPWTSSW